MANVTLEPCGAERRATLDALFQLYTHDFSKFWAGTDRGDLQEDGRFPDYPHLDLYWTEADRSAWLIRADGYLAGFVLVNTHSHAGLPLDQAVAEFFVVRKYRGAGVGRAAARTIITSKAGQWELAIARKNTGALRFWRGVAEDLASGSVEALDTQEPWNGMILRFAVA